MPEVPIKSASIVCKVHSDGLKDGCAVCGTIKALLEEAHKYKQIREKLMERLIIHLKERNAILNGIA